MAEKEYTYSEVSEHNTKKDLFIVVHDKVYNASSFVDEHPYVTLLLRSPDTPSATRLALSSTPHCHGGSVVSYDCDRS